MEVTISPSSSCYFAGEKFTCSITFTNTSTASAPSRPHRRGHSISSAPLARPPTSPGVFRHKYAPSSPANIASNNLKKDPSNAPSTAPLRKGLLGDLSSNPSAPEHLSKARAKRFAASKSLSVALSQNQAAHIVASSESSKSRTTSADKPFPPNYPHARKQSIQWATATSSFDSGPSTASSSPSPSPSPSPYPVPLEPINEAVSPGPLANLPSITPATDSAACSGKPPDAAPGVPSNILNSPVPTRARGFGVQFPSVSPNGPRSASAGTLPIPGTETLLWAYAHLSGSVDIDPELADSEQLRSLKAQLARSGPIGGGRMDLHQLATSTRSLQTNEGIWSSLFGHSGRATPQVSSTSPGGGWMSGWLGSRSSPAASRMVNQVLPEGSALTDTIWTFNPPQSMLAVDLILMPGESRTYTYSIELPHELPPTFRGRAFRFSYNLTVGTCRGRLATIDSQIAQPSIHYDLLWPAYSKGGKTIGQVEEKDSRPPVRSVTRKDLSTLYFDQLRQFGQNLAGDLVRQRSINEEDDLADADGNSCRLAVEVLTRQARRAVYDVHRGGASVASLLLPKTTFRLGEAVHGIISLNCFEQGLAVAKVTILLETYERLPDLLTREVKPGGLRRIQAEQHGECVLGLRRTHFSLDIPSDASPGFGVSVNSQGKGGLEWRVRVCFLVGDGSSKLEPVGTGGEWGSCEVAGDGELLGKLETVECEVPIAVLPAHTVFGSIPVSFPV